MPDAAPAQVIDLLATAVAGWPDLSGWTVVSDADGQTRDKAFEDADYPLVSIAMTAWAVDNDMMQGHTRHEIEIEFEIVSGKETAGVISRNNMTGLAHVIAAISQDRTLGGRIEDIQETEIADAGPSGVDAGATALVTRATFYTPRDDWFTLAT